MAVLEDTKWCRRLMKLTIIIICMVVCLLHTIIEQLVLLCL